MGSPNERTEFDVQPFIIPAGGTTSAIKANPRFGLVGLRFPALFTGTSVTFEVSDDGTTYVPVYDKTGTQYAVVVGPSRYVIIPPGETAGFQWIKIISNAAEGVERTVYGTYRPV